MTTLYKTTKTGAIQQWSVEVQGDSFICTYGQVDGAMQTQTTKCEPKNVGRSNETTPEQQAILEAEALVTKKLKSGYSYDKTAPVTVQLPQKVKSYQDQLKNVIFPCISTPKLNGVNATYWLMPDNSLKLTSRGGETYPAIPHLEDSVRTLMNFLGTTALNGELYIHGEHLQDIQSAVKKPKELSKQLEFNVFELPLIPGSYEVKHKIMQDTLEELSNFFEDTNNKVLLLTGVECHSHEDIEVHYNQCMQAKLEGTVIYNIRAVYKFNTRSSDVFKYKKVQSKEFLIASYELDKNKLPVFIMNVGEQFFKAKPKGTKEFWANFDFQDYRDQWATIEFETYSKAGIPLKPIFIGLRDCDEFGEPKE